MRVPLLSYKEEIALAKQFEQGRKAQQQLTQGGHVPQDRARLEQDLGRRPTPEEIAEEVELTPDRVRWMMRVWWQPISLDKPVGEEGDREFDSLIENQNAPSSVQSTEQHLLCEDLEKALIALAPREARVLRLRFGLQGELSHSLEEIGNKIGVTRERARQIVRAALRKLRHPRNRRRLQSYLG